VAVATQPATPRQGQDEERVALGAVLAGAVQRVVAESAVAAVTLGAAFLAGSVLLIFTATNPLHVIGAYGPTLHSLGLLLHYPFIAYDSLFSGAFGAPDMATTALTIGQAVPLVFTGLAVAVAFRAGLFNIGAEGQLYVGAIVATWVGLTFASAPAVVLLPLVLLSSILAGMVWGGISGFLKAYRGAHEVITTIMLNWIAIYFTTALVTAQGPLNAAKAQGQATSEHIGSGGLLPTLGNSSSSLNAGVYLAVVAVVLVWFLVSRTSLGYEIRAIGLNPGAAAYGGIPVRRRIVLAMAIAGGLGGLAGGVHIADPGAGAFQSQFSPGWGFDGIAVALLGKGNPIGIILSAILFGALRTGSQNMQTVGVSPHMTELLQGIIIFFIALDALARKLLDWRRARAVVDDSSGARAAASPSPIASTDPNATIDATTVAGRAVPVAPARGRRRGAADAWRGLLLLSIVSATCALLFTHVLFGALAILLAALFVAIQGRPSRGALLIALYGVVCLALGLGINPYL